MKEIITQSIDILCVNGKCYVNMIEKKEEEDRTWYDKLYLWYYNNFINIILFLGFCLLLSMVYYLFNKSKSNPTNYKGSQLSGGGFKSQFKKSSTTGFYTPIIQKQASKQIKSTGLPTSTAALKEKAGKAGEAIIKAPGKATKAIRRGGKNFVLGAKAHAKSFYVILFSITIVIGFGFFFIPTICMLLIGFLTYQLTKMQIVSMFTA